MKKDHNREEYCLEAHHLSANEVDGKGNCSESIEMSIETHRNTHLKKQKQS